MDAITVSAPGKVLIVGGYLVLQEGIPGLVVSTSSRFHASIESAATGELPWPTGWVESPFTEVAVLVESPQFREKWTYTLSVTAPFVLTPTSLKADGVTFKRNPYAEHAIELALCAASQSAACAGVAGRLLTLASAGRALHIMLRADNEFYSQRAHLTARGLSVSLESLAALPRFLPCPEDSDRPGQVVINKTGLGSSAALVTSLTAAVLCYCGAVNLPGLNHADSNVSGAASASYDAGAKLVHDVAQVAHGLAQGKIGSGFDVCSAAFGSIGFARIPPTVLGQLMDAAQKSACAAADADVYSAFGKTLISLSSSDSAEDGSVAKQWNYEASPFVLPDGLVLMLADVVGGSETPSMVRQVLAWRDRGDAAGSTAAAAAADPASNAAIDGDGNQIPDAEQAAAMRRQFEAAVGPCLWKRLAAANARVAVVVEQLRRLSNSNSTAYAAGLRTCATVPAASWSTLAAPESTASTADVISKLSELHTSFGTARRLLREMGSEAGVPIEPAVQTALADASVGVAGVVAAGVPGAGGFDALFAVILEPEALESSSGASSTGAASAVGNVRKAVESCWVGWPGGGLTPLLLRDGPGRGQAGAGVQAKATFDA